VNTALEHEGEQNSIFVLEDKKGYVYLKFVEIRAK